METRSAGLPGVTCDDLTKTKETKMAIDWSKVSLHSEVNQGEAANPNTPVATLEQLATDADNYVRLTVARNPNTPAASLEQMATDADSDVRWEVRADAGGPGRVGRESAGEARDIIVVRQRVCRAGEPRDRHRARGCARRMGGPHRRRHLSFLTITWGNNLPTF